MHFCEFYLDEETNTFYHGSTYQFNNFDMNKVGTGDGLNKYGFGLYFAKSPELAEYYARENFLKNKHVGMFIYEVNLRQIEEFLPWDELITEDLYLKIADELENEYPDDSSRMKEELQSYGDTYTMDQMYNILSDTLGGDKKATTFLYDNNVSGVISDDIHGRGKIYVAFSDDIVKILGVRKLK